MRDHLQIYMMRKLMNYRFISVIALLVFVFLLPVSASDTLSVQNHMYQIDHSKKVIVIIEHTSILNQQVTNGITGILLDRYYEFDAPAGQAETGIPYVVMDPEGSVYMLFFSRIPLVTINTPHKIEDEPRVYTEFELIEPDGTTTSSIVGAEIRGGLSQSFPKQSMRLEFWKDSEGRITKNVSLLGMRDDDDWNLQAMYNEPLRFRSKTSNMLWKLMHTLYYSDREPGGVNGIEMEYVELFVNGEYRGIYALGERIDRKQLQLKEYTGNWRGELYKGVNWGVPTFHELPDYNNDEPYWDGFELQYPDEPVDWTNLYGFVDFIINEEDYYFYSDLRHVFEPNNAVDYFIFLNLLRAVDNTGKNAYIARYDYDEPYYYVPWDLDGVFGNMYLGERDPKTEGLLSNGLYDRLYKDCQASGFRNMLRTRWNSLRQNIITRENIMALFLENYHYLESNGAYMREELAWDKYSFNIEDLAYMENWLQARLTNLDEEFNTPCQPHSISEPTDDRIILFPNPVSGPLNINISGGLLPFEFIIYNNTGQTVTTGTVREKSTSIQLPLQAGMYFIILQNSYHRESKKIIVGQ